MTPFDPAALLAMLLAFYQPASPAHLLCAFQERPEYFAGGTLSGSHGDKLRLQDGRIFDLIFDVDNATGNRHYQVLDVTHQTGADDPFPLEPGPLTPLDPATFTTPLPREAFIDLVGDVSALVDGHLTRVDAGYTTIVEHSTPTRIDAASGTQLGAAAAAHAASAGAFGHADPSDVIETTHAHATTIPGYRGDYEDPDPPEFVPVDPGPIPPQGPTQPPVQD